MNWVDYAILAILGLSVLMGFWRGLIAGVLALVVWLLAFWVAWLLGPDVALWLEPWIDVPSVRVIVAYVACFVAVLAIGALFKSVVDRLVESTGLSGSDRLLGMLFGLARGVVLVTLAVFLLGFSPFTRDPWWHQSRLLPTFTGLADWLGERVPDTVGRYVHSWQPDLSAMGLPTSTAARVTGLPAASDDTTVPAPPPDAVRHADSTPTSAADRR